MTNEKICPDAIRELFCGTRSWLRQDAGVGELGGRGPPRKITAPRAPPGASGQRWTWCTPTGSSAGPHRWLESSPDSGGTDSLPADGSVRFVDYGVGKR